MEGKKAREMSERKKEREINEEIEAKSLHYLEKARDR